MATRDILICYGHFLRFFSTQAPTFIYKRKKKTPADDTLGRFLFLFLFFSLVADK